MPLCVIVLCMESWIFGLDLVGTVPGRALFHIACKSRSLALSSGIYPASHGLDLNPTWDQNFFKKPTGFSEWSAKP